MAARAGAFSMHVYRKGQIRPQEEEIEDEPDESYPVICDDDVPDGVRYRMPDLQKVPGYENIGFDSDFCPAPKQTNEEVEYKHPSFNNTDLISEAAARRALLQHVSEQPCWGKSAAEKMWLKRLEPVTSYQYTLETFSEGRTAKWKSAPYNEGETINGPNNKRVLTPWEVPAKPKEMFVDGVVHLQVPDTEIVKGCHKCNQTGYLRCIVCIGRGKLRCGKCLGKGIRKRLVDQERQQYKYLKCDPCGGEGKVICVYCDNTGKENCDICRGNTELKWHISLTVTWKRHVAEHLIERTLLPDDLVSKVPGNICFEDTRPKLLPLRNFPDVEINHVSRKFLRQHTFSNHRILMQKHKIRAVPVSQCKCHWKDKDFDFIVYGLDNHVYCPDYPQQCACSIQ